MLSSSANFVIYKWALTRTIVMCLGISLFLFVYVNLVDFGLSRNPRRHGHTGDTSFLLDYFEIESESFMEGLRELCFTAIRTAYQEKQSPSSLADDEALQTFIKQRTYGKKNSNSSINAYVDSFMISTLEEAIQQLTKGNVQPSKRKMKTLNIFAQKPYGPHGLRDFHHFINAISDEHLYSAESSLVDKVLNDMATMVITDMEDLSEKGTSVKFKFWLENNMTVLFKPKRTPRDYHVPEDTYYMYEIPRHHAEIAAFHLDRVLGFNKVTPAVGRMINLKDDVERHAGSKLQKTFFTSPAGNLCFYGICEYFCDKLTPICSRQRQLEGALVLYFPPEVEIEGSRNPWARSYKTSKLADWELNPSTFCADMRKGQDQRLLDIIDAHIFDFLTGNMDRHLLYEFAQFKYDKSTRHSFLVALDNDSGFGRPGTDVISILAPLVQCCKVRLSTLQKLLPFVSRGRNQHPIRSLSSEMTESLSRDPLDEPVLTSQHLRDLDRRVNIVVKEIYQCIQRNNGYIGVIIKDDIP